MRGDPTTKPCVLCHGTGRVTVTLGEPHTCAHCHGTGRVPMAMGELLLAAAKRIGEFELHHWIVDDGRSEWVIYRDSSEEGILGRGPTPDDALRAALRGVNHA